MGAGGDRGAFRGGLAAPDPPVPGGLALGGGALLIALLLVARKLVVSRLEYLGLRCQRCRATYAYGTPFFTELDANPRQLKVEDVPRPLGSSPFERGRFVLPAPPAPPDRFLPA